MLLWAPAWSPPPSPCGPPPSVLSVPPPRRRRPPPCAGEVLRHGHVREVGHPLSPSPLRRHPIRGLENAALLRRGRTTSFRGPVLLPLTVRLVMVVGADVVNTAAPVPHQKGVFHPCRIRRPLLPPSRRLRPPLLNSPPLPFGLGPAPGPPSSAAVAAAATPDCR